jgi:hypothetical protein
MGDAAIRTRNVDGTQQCPIEIDMPQRGETADDDNVCVEIQHTLDVLVEEFLDPKPRPVVERVMGPRIERKQAVGRRYNSRNDSDLFAKRASVRASFPSSSRSVARPTTTISKYRSRLVSRIEVRQTATC